MGYFGGTIITGASAMHFPPMDGVAGVAQHLPVPGSLYATSSALFSCAMMLWGEGAGQQKALWSMAGVMDLGAKELLVIQDKYNHERNTT